MKIGFYLHTRWEFEYPFAVRSWGAEDFTGWFTFMNQLGMNLLMLWPLCEAMPAPLSEHDRESLLNWKQIVADAQSHGLETWITQTANCTTHPAIAEQPFKARHFYPFRIDVQLDDPAARDTYFAHRADLMRVLDNADGYVTIDGDPGSYPQAHPDQFLEVFEHDRALLNAIGRSDARLVPWLWSGWGSDWDTYGAWQESLELLTAPVLDLLKERMPTPWTLLPGRSVREGWANGRENFRLTEEAGLVENSVLLCYEIIEFEPTPPAFQLQFDDIRRVLREESPLLAKARGIMGNAQQPIVALPNLFFFAHAAHDPHYLVRRDEDILRDLAAFLGGDPNILVPAWQSGYLPLDAIPPDLPARLRATLLTTPAAAGLPGGAPRYLDILAVWVETRLAILRTCAQAPSLSTEAAIALSDALQALISWWQTHHYVFTGEAGTNFRLEWTHDLLLAPLRSWCANLTGDRTQLKAAALRYLGATNALSQDELVTALDALLPF